MEPAEASFHWADYLIFILTLVISTAIGIFFAWKDRHKQNASEFLLGGRKMGILPVSLSLMATLLSAVMVLGVPAEVYYNGTMYWMILFSNLIVYPLAAQAFLPVYHNMGLTSAYEYLELRFNTLMRVIGCVVFQIQMTLSMSLGLFAPAIALNQGAHKKRRLETRPHTYQSFYRAIGITAWYSHVLLVMKIDMLISILVIGVICTFYTAIGGLKAVMWTDSFQMLIIMGGFIALVVQGTNEVGGFDVVWETARNNSKLEIFDFNPSPLERHTFWTLIFGAGITTLTVYGGNQAMVQRYLSMESVTKAKIALYLQLPAGVIVTTLFVYGGLVLHARYPVDPVSDCTIDLPDQLIPWMVMDVLGNFHGFPGLMLACIFSASLSTVSSGINAIALVFMADIVEPASVHFYGKPVGEPKATILSKIIAIVSGAVTIGLAFAAELFGPLILQVALSIYGMVGGPLLGLFICAMFIPIVNSWGAFTGLIAGLGMSFWLSIGAILYANEQPAPPRACPSGDGGTTSNVTSLMTTGTTMMITADTTTFTSLMVDESKSGLEMFYSLSYLWYSTFAVTVVIVVAVTVSCLTGGTRKKPVDKRLLSPLYHTICSFSRINEDPKESDHKTANGSANGTAKAYNEFDDISDQTSEPDPPAYTYENPAFTTKM